MSIYLKFGSVNGGVMTKGFEKWIECSSFSFGVHRIMTTAARSSSASVSEVRPSRSSPT